jgi:large subunit ribosomal protein L17
MHRNLVTALIKHERIETTVAKAKEVRRYADKMVTWAKQGDVAARSHANAFVFERPVVDKLFKELGPRYVYVEFCKITT